MIDNHAHCFFYKDGWRNCVEESIQKGVNYIVESGLNYETNEIVYNESKEYEQVYFSVGLHPTDAIKLSWEEVEKVMEQMKEFCKDKKCVGIGEIGLDYYWVKEKPLIDKQKGVFRKLLELAQELDRPVIIHSRDAEEDCLKILSEYDVRVVLHSFMPRKNWKPLLEFAVAKGYYISIPAFIVKNKRLKKIARDTPVELILTETDTPFLDPEGNGRNNKPWKVKYALEEIAKIKGTSVEELDNIIEDNFRKIYRA